MCGIVGYVGNQQAAPILLEGLSKLEYRGYDSAGVAIYDGDKIIVEKCKGRLSVLSERLQGGLKINGTLGIGHTRWATHGAPSDVNSHPHINKDGKIAVVHNGIIENYLKIKDFLIKKGYTFVSDTDTEVIAHLADYYYNGNILDTVINVINKLEGSYALGIICKDNPGEFVAVRKDSPLIIGLSDDGNFAASDIPAVLPYTRSIYILEDDEIVILSRDSVTVYNTEKEIVTKEVFNVEWDVHAAEKGGHEHFMFKEIMEQPKAIRDTISTRIKEGKINLDDFKLTPEYIKDIDNVYIVACGSAYHVVFVWKYIIEKLARIHVDVDLASEFRYRAPIITDKTLIIVISQSGETADTIAALREGKKRGARVLSVVNVVGSTISRESDDVIYTWAGPEIAVATTKAYSTQLSVMYLIASYFAQEKKLLCENDVNRIINTMLQLPSYMENIIENKDNIQYFASKHYNSKDIFFIGRGVDYAVALEGSLKLKEISYIHSEAYAAGELKHGTISLIEDGTLVVALATQEALFEKMVSNIKEVKARGANVIAVVKESNKEIERVADSVIYLPDCDDLISPSLAVLPLQLFAYYVAVMRGCDVDKPRNLAKSVTVE